MVFGSVSTDILISCIFHFQTICSWLVSRGGQVWLVVSEHLTINLLHFIPKDFCKAIQWTILIHRIFIINIQWVLVFNSIHKTFFIQMLAPVPVDCLAP